ncbi:GtrA family protein [Streptomyces axinellae]|uniref:GtrA family protein n=1 Tax=Streptomyces axinellae TaxID=552788 RepID=UPI0031D8F823
MPARARGFGAELGGFAAVGVFAFAADVGAFLWLRGPMGLDPLAAKAVSFVAGCSVAYAGNALGPYRPRGGGEGGAGPGTGWWRRFGIFVLVNVAGAAVQLACLWISRYGLGRTSVRADLVAGAGVGMALATALRFWGTRTLVFRATRTPTRTSTRTPT